MKEGHKRRKRLPECGGFAVYWGVATRDVDLRAACSLLSLGPGLCRETLILGQARLCLQPLFLRLASIAEITENKHKEYPWKEVEIVVY